MYDVIIVGAGPAGLTAAIYACRANLKVLVLEAMTYGGQIINTPSIENYPALFKVSGFDFATNLYNQAKELGSEIKFEKVVKIIPGKEKEVITSTNSYKAKAIIIATGAVSRKLNLPNEDEFVGKGISYCATCDGNFYKGQVVAVNGGGNTALEDAIYLADIAKKVYLIHRRDTFRADASLVEQAKKKGNIEFILNSTITKLNGDDKLTSITLSNNKELNIDGLFIAIGRVPETSNFTSIVKTTKDGYFESNEECLTNQEGIFVAGDARKKELRQLVTATSDGAIAATKTIKYIKNYDKDS